jgi:hypothetical protein
MIERAAIDRFENGWAVLFVGEDERKVNVPRSMLPRHVSEGQWLRIEFDGEEIVSVEIDKEETARVKKRISEKLARLRLGEHRKQDK